MKKSLAILLVVVLIMGFVGMVSAEALLETTDYQEEYLAAPAVAGILLSDAGIDNRWGTGKNGGNYISMIARHMGEDATFEGVSKEDKAAYRCEVLKFLKTIVRPEDGLANLPNCYEYVETVLVDSRKSTPTLSTMALENGGNYRLKATGVADAGDTIDFDASYSITNRISGDTWTNTVSGYVSHGEALLGLHVDGLFPDWGEFNDEHTYYLDYLGTGSQVALWIWDIYYPNNNGFLTVEIYRVW